MRPARTVSLVLGWILFRKPSLDWFVYLTDTPESRRYGPSLVGEDITHDMQIQLHSGTSLGPYADTTRLVGRHKPMGIPPNFMWIIVE